MAMASSKKGLTRLVIERDKISTPSAIASSIAARILASEHQPFSQHTLYTAMRAEGTPPLANPTPNPYKPALSTRRPATVDATCVPCPLVSMGPQASVGGRGPSARYARAPMIFLNHSNSFQSNNIICFFFFFFYIHVYKVYLLQRKLAEASQVPFHLGGGGPRPWSSKLKLSGQIPESRTPTMMLLSC